MASLTIRRLDDEVYARLRAQAKRNDRSIEAEARQVLAQQVAEEPLLDRAAANERIDRLRALLDRQPLDPSYPGSVATIRAIRDEE